MKSKAVLPFAKASDFKPIFLMNCYYIGLANTCHDPAIAIVDSTGNVLFAEALERQGKRISNPIDTVVLAFSVH
ncbi:hypothetical protein Cylst_1888 [Cylindrospermum stagnale PCC 7417]|uniref:Uncharacterized protein n=1 Tax=Cylindrospermum stagnale PCC 7417 TaxID=56107 RepID=K9WXB7_9NOST|nr:hypothetical protein [Cylindrospermum stagnale]AFZ24137.1 hypothetical protein Cylst_1888 [Cylindrospermum stagnale PCC 7417]